MKFIVLLFLITWFITTGVSQNLLPSNDSIKKHVYFLASEDLKGRDTGEDGQRIAAQYIKNSFERYGLKKLNNQSYFHNYTLMRKHKNSLVVKNSGNILFGPWHFHFVSGYNHADTLNTQIVFTGFGTNNEIEPLEIGGKAIALIAESPKEVYKTIINIKNKHGNRTFFVIFTSNNKDINKEWGNKYELSSYNLPAAFKKINSQTITETWAKPTDSVSIYYCFADVLQNVLGENDNTLERIAKNNIASDYKLLPDFPESEITLLTNYADFTETVEVENVGGIIYGKDTTKTIVVSAHYDHIGVELEKINYGADDNASGTAALLESARLMELDSENGIKPAVNVLFIAFSGEELGLLGSEAFVTDTLTNLSAITLNINMDMIGRWDDRHNESRDFVYLLTAGPKSKKLFKLGKKHLNLPKGFVVSNKPGPKEKVVFRYGSDHYSFIKKDISIAVFFTGLHDDYHTPRDTPDKINYKNLTTITNMVYQYIYKIN